MLSDVCPLCKTLWITSHRPLHCMALAVLFMYVRGTKKRSRSRESVVTVMTVAVLPRAVPSIYISTQLLGARHHTRGGGGVLGLELESKLYHFALGP